MQGIPAENRPAGRSKSDDALRNTLSKLAHLDLTPHTRYDSTVMAAHGGYCDVFIGTVKISSISSFSQPMRATKVAVKRLRVHMQSDRDFAKLLAKELYVWSKLDHVNILPFLGYVLEGHYPSVVSEWIENGTVVRYMKENPDIDIEPLILGIANGVEYLHKQSIVHSDLKGDNVLVGRSGEPLICDFGISHMLYSSLTVAAASTGGLKGSVRWMALELLDITSDTHHTKESDVWAYGMTIYEILARELPYSHLKIDALVLFAILRGELPSRPPEFDTWSLFLQSAWKMCEQCWASPPKDRITMEQVVTFLNARKCANVANSSRDSSSSSSSSCKTPALISSLVPPTVAAAKKILNLVAVADDAPTPEWSSEGITMETWPDYILESGNLVPVPMGLLANAKQEHSSGGTLGVTLVSHQTNMHPSGPYQFQQKTFISGMIRTYVPSSSIHPILRDARHVHLDLASHSCEPYIPPHEASLSQAMSDPAMTDIRLICRAFGAFADLWEIKIKPGRTISIGDVLYTVHDELYTRVTRAEWSMISDSYMDKIGEAYIHRCRAPALEKVEGVRRVDLLGKKHWFGGLEKVKDDDPHNFELLVETRSPP